MNSYMNVYVFALDNFKQINKKYYTIYYIILYYYIMYYILVIFKKRLTYYETKKYFHNQKEKTNKQTNIFALDIKQKIINKKCTIQKPHCF